jgi:hypothetical protein
MQVKTQGQASWVVEDKIWHETGGIMFFLGGLTKIIKPNARAHDQRWRKYSTSSTSTSFIQGCGMLVDNLGFWFAK